MGQQTDTAGLPLSSAAAKAVRGRTEKGTGQEKMINLTTLDKATLDTLVADYKHAVAAKDRFSDGVKAVAEKAGLNAGPLQRYIKARAGDRLDEKRKDAEQLDLLFREMAGR